MSNIILIIIDIGPISYVSHIFIYKLFSIKVKILRSVHKELINTDNYRIMPDLEVCL